ncbi:hypothetical protein ACWKXX_09955 [Enterobacter sp. UPMP2061]
MKKRIDELIEICNQHGISNSILEGDRKVLNFKLGRERGFTDLYIREGRVANEFISNDFYKYKFVLGYEAIWSEEDDVIECMIDCAPYYGFWERVLYRYFNPSDESLPIRNADYIIKIAYDGEEKIEISNSSDTFSCLYSFRNKDRFRLSRSNPTTIRVTGAGVKTHSDALKIIKGLMSTICFQLDCTTGLPLQLLAEQQQLGKRHKDFTNGQLSIPKFDYSYDVEALALYWNATSLIGMPLGQYLAFYQTIEFYYTVYSYRDAQLRIKNLLKQPSFDVSKDKDLSKILNIVKFNNNSNAFGSELEQLKATLKHCIDIDDFKDFIEQQNFEKETFTNKSIKKLSKCEVHIQYEDAEVLFSQIARRIYEIRCRIVHTKGVQDNVETLHPLSNEVRFINQDLKLIEFVARQILIANSQPLNR